MSHANVVFNVSVCAPLANGHTVVKVGRRWGGGISKCLYQLNICIDTHVYNIFTMVIFIVQVNEIAPQCLLGFNIYVDRV